MINKIIYIRGTDDDAGLVLDQDGKELSSVDRYHGEDVNESLLKVLGVKIANFNHEELISESEYQPSNCSNEIANKELVIERIKDLIKKNKVKYE